MENTVRSIPQAYSIYMREMRRALHQIPEIAFCEIKTQAFLVSELKKLGYLPKVVRTGVIVDVKEGKDIIAFRCDMDALALTEQTDCDYKSRHEGVMHACGHDAHMAMLLGLAKYLSENPPIVPVRLIFQPAEEGEGGALSMIEAGCLEDVSEIYAIHVAPDIPEGILGVCRGASMAGAVEFNVNITGRSAHAAQKERGADALQAAAVTALQLETLARDISAQTMLLHVGKLTAGTARNIVAAQAKLEATLRYFDREKKEGVMFTIGRIAKSCAEQFGATAEIETAADYIPVVNADRQIEKAMRAAEDAVEIPKQYTAEDFAFYCDRVPGAILWLGVGRGGVTGLHTPTFDFDEDNLLNGLKIYLNLLDLRAEEKREE